MQAYEGDTCVGIRAYLTKEEIIHAINDIPSAEPEPEEFEWCHDCKEYDKDKHCCHRWTKVIRQTIDEVKANAEMKVTDTWKVAGCHELNAWCPNCEHRVTRGCSYCPTCGVKLDWSERDERPY